MNDASHDDRKSDSFTLLDNALWYRKLGLSIIPIRADGSKAPAVPSWQRYQHEPASLDELREWFGNGVRKGIAIIGGAVSGNLGVIDFDEPSVFPRWRQVVSETGGSLSNRLVEVETPSGGRHIYYRCTAGVGGNTILAARDKSDPVTGKKVLIETRGEGGYVLAAGSPVECHPSGRPYELRSGSFSNISAITADERLLLHNAARSFDMRQRKAKTFKQPKLSGVLRPGDEFNRTTTWSFLETHGWQPVTSVGQLEYWRRPGKEDGISATTNFAGRDLLYVFSGNAPPFESETGYTKFTAYALLNHGGDFAAAAKALVAGGQVTDSVPPRFDDIGNSERFVRMFGNDVRWLAAFRKWLVWSGSHWEFDDKERVLGMAKQVARSILNEVKHVEIEK